MTDVQPDRPREQDPNTTNPQPGQRREGEDSLQDQARRESEKNEGDESGLAGETDDPSPDAA